jgi:hypothetical protein
LSDAEKSCTAPRNEVDGGRESARQKRDENWGKAKKQLSLSKVAFATTVGTKKAHALAAQFLGDNTNAWDGFLFFKNHNHKVQPKTTSWRATLNSDGR